MKTLSKTKPNEVVTYWEPIARGGGKRLVRETRAAGNVVRWEVVTTVRVPS